MVEIKLRGLFGSKVNFSGRTSELATHVQVSTIDRVDVAAIDEPCARSVCFGGDLAQAARRSPQKVLSCCNDRREVAMARLIQRPEFSLGYDGARGMILTVAERARGPIMGPR